jgi:hypothetical protein
MSEPLLRSPTPEEKAHVLALGQAILETLDAYHNAHPDLSYQVYLTALAHASVWLQEQAADA